MLHHGRQLGGSGRPVAGQLFRRTHALLLFVFDILFLGAFRHFVLLRRPLKELPPRALPENVRHSLGEITLKRVDFKDSKPPERTVLGDAVEVVSASLHHCEALSKISFTAVAKDVLLS